MAFPETFKGTFQHDNAQLYKLNFNSQHKRTQHKHKESLSSVLSGLVLQFLFLF
jgi:hypothetical protein